MNKDILKVLIIISTTIVAALIVIFGRDVITAAVLEGIISYYVLKQKDK